MPYNYKSGDTTTTIVSCDKSLLIRIENVRTGECMSSMIPPKEFDKIKRVIDGPRNEIDHEPIRRISISSERVSFASSPQQWDRAKSIIEIVVKEYGIPREVLITKKRTADIVRPRHIAFYLIRKYTDLSLPQTSGLFDKHYTAVVFGIRALNKRMIADEQLAAHIKRLEQKIEQENSNEAKS